MSSPDLSRRTLLALSGTALLAVSLGGCFRPLHGPTASGARVTDLLAAIEVGEVVTTVAQERFAHHIRSELVFELNGSGAPAPEKRYKLAMQAQQSVQTQIVESSTGRADAATLIGSVAYTLTDRSDKIIVKGVASGSAVYDRNVQRFATIRAARDAEIRLGKLLAEQIRSRLAAVLLTTA